jgi:cell division septation protein DedD
VRLERGGPTDTVVADAGAVAPPAAESGGGASETPVAPNETLNYPKVLGGDAPPAEKIAPAEAPAAKPEPVGEVPPSPPPSEPAPPVPTPAAKAAPPSAPGEPSGPGLAVQVAAFRVRGEADALALRLISKEYKAYVVPPSAGAPPLFRVRVGKFKEQREADQVVAKLKKEEQFEPWIVR